MLYDKNDITIEGSTTLSNMENVEHIIPVNFNISIDQCIKQNRQRTGLARVPDHVIERMYRFHQDPTFHEKYKYKWIWNVAKEGD